MGARRSGNEQFQKEQQLRDVLNNQAEPAPQVYLFGSRARGDWDWFSDTDLLLDHGVAQDVIALDQEAWRQLPDHPSVIWRHVARDAVSLLEQEPRE